jgi:hypothetical protein
MGEDILSSTGGFTSKNKMKAWAQYAVKLKEIHVKAGNADE